MNDRYVFFTGSLRTDYSSGVLKGPNYFDSFVLVGYNGSDQPYLALVYVRTLCDGLGRCEPRNH